MATSNSASARAVVMFATALAACACNGGSDDHGSDGGDDRDRDAAADADDGGPQDSCDGPEACALPRCGGRVCRRSRGACDLAETCDGRNLRCPADGLAAEGTRCRAAAGACDIAESCDGASVQCPEDLLAATGAVCRAAVGSCDSAETCSGASPGCPPDTLLTDTPCDDGSACTAGDTCQAGVCTGGAPVVCRSLDECHEAGTCDPATGECSSPSLSDGTPCEDGNHCTENDACQGGRCSGGSLTTCDDLNPCTADACEPEVGCAPLYLPGGASCADMDLCNGEETCDGTGICTAGVPPAIDDDQPCTLDSCDAGRGVIHTPLAAGTPCGLGAFCAGDGTCRIAFPIPPLDSSITTTVFDASEFLYTGDNPSQTGVAAGVIDPIRAAVVRGRVLQRDGAFLGDVTVTILGHPEFGRTVTRSDGMFDMVVNGGGPLTVQYSRSGFIPIDRQSHVVWQDYTILPDAEMIPYDSQVTPIDLAGSPELQVARGSAVEDADGVRQATLLFPPGTLGELVLPDGSRQALEIANVRATEFTVGANGPSAMPAELPKTSAYTYALELSVDEAAAMQAVEVLFDQPIYLHVENFLGFRVGSSVPVGYYDRARGVWVASPNGRVIRLLDPTVEGLANVDADGDDLADDAPDLLALGIGDGERRQLAALYPVDQTLWRVPITHFTPWDCNWPYAPPDDALPPEQPAPEVDEPLDEPTNECGSVIGSENQSLGEAADVTGTPFRLHYESDRVLGRLDARSVQIPLSGAALPPGVGRIDLEVSVAGTRFTQSFAPAPNLSHRFVWDGRDAFDRIVQGKQRVLARIGYVYSAVYEEPEQVENAFARFSGVPLSGNRARQEATLWQEWRGAIGSWDARGVGLGGWSLSVHHVYDPVGRIVYLGTGERRSAGPEIRDVVQTVAGNGSFGSQGDGGPPTEASIEPGAIAVGADGSVYFAETSFGNVRRIAPDGTLSTIASGLAGPGGLAVDADGTVYVTEIGARCGVLRVAPDGSLSTAVSCDANWLGEGLPTSVVGPTGLALGADGSLYIADLYASIVWRLGPDGRLGVVAGNGRFFRELPPPGTPANQAALYLPNALAVGSDGSLYLAENLTQLRRVRPDGIIETFAGSFGGYSGDGGPARDARMWNAAGVAIDPADDTVFILDDRGWIREVDSNGTISTLAGSGQDGFAGDGGPARRAQFAFGAGGNLAVAPNGSVYVADVNNLRIRRIAPDLPGISAREILVPSRDGREAYVFNRQGKHLRTVDAYSGVDLYTFGYDGEGRLDRVSDRDGNSVTVDRDADGRPVAIVAPGGQRTILATNADGYLELVRDTAGLATDLRYGAEGLLTSLVDANRNLHTFTYDAEGRLIEDLDPAGGSVTLSGSSDQDGRTVTLNNALGEERGLFVDSLATGGLLRRGTGADGTQKESTTLPDGTRVDSLSGGTIVSTTEEPDPRWGMLAPIVAEQRITTPAGLTFVSTTSRDARLGVAGDPFSLTQLTETTTINGRAYTSVYDATARRLTITSPAGRQIVRLYDARGRIIEARTGGLAPVSFTYDLRGRQASIAQGALRPRIRSFGYDAQDRVAEVIDPLGRTTAFGHDAAGRLAEERLPDGEAIRWSFDAMGNLASVTPPGRLPHTLSYTQTGLVSRYAPPGADGTDFVYGLDRRLSEQIRADGSTVRFDHDAFGRVETLRHPHASVVFAYDSDGRTTSVASSDGTTVAYGFDGSLVLEDSLSGPVSGRINSEHDEDFRIISESVNDSSTVTFAYDPDGLLVQAGELAVTLDPADGLVTSTELGGVTDRYTYDEFGDRQDYRASFGGTELFAESVVRDDLGRMTQDVVAAEGDSQTITYTYDERGRLVEVSRDAIVTARYGYDANGNRISVDRPGGGGGIVEGSYADDDRLLTYGEVTFSYGTGGELASRDDAGVETSYDYDAMGNLRTVLLADGRRIDYVVDGLGRRVGRRVDGTLVQGFLYRGAGMLVAELDGFGAVVSRFVHASPGQVPDYMLRGGRTYRIIVDQRGSPSLVVDVTSGEVAQRMDYDELGRVLLDTNPGFQPFGFAGGLYDRDTGFLHFEARDYDPETGRFTTKDPLGFGGGAENLYEYASGDPVNFVDPTGLEPTPFARLERVFYKTKEMLTLQGKRIDSSWPEENDWRVSMEWVWTSLGAPGLDKNLEGCIRQASHLDKALRADADLMRHWDVEWRHTLYTDFRETGILAWPQAYVRAVPKDPDSPILWVDLNMSGGKITTVYKTGMLPPSGAPCP